MRARIAITLLILPLCMLWAAASAEVPMTTNLEQFVLPTTRPALACTPEELARLRAAWRAPGAQGDVVRARIKAAGAVLGSEVVFPPRGGQHNQWYQCDRCQLALQTVDATHHKCPKCGTVYTGEPYDDVLFKDGHGRNLRRMLDGAWAYAITGETKYADDARQVLLGYAERYRQYPYHTANRSNDPKQTSGGHIAEQTLNEAVMMAMQIAPACDLIDGALTAGERAAIRDGLLLPMLANIDRHRTGKNNWQSWHNAGLFAGAAYLGDTALARRTIDDPRNGFLFQMGESVSAEGMWYENSWSYHAYTLQALVAHAEAARRCGIDLWGRPPFRNMFLLPPQYTMADGSLPRFGDAVGAAPGVNPPQLEAAYHAYREPQLPAMLPAAPSWESVLYGRDITAAAAAPALTSTVLREAGHAILRTAGDGGLTAALTFGPFGGFHGHFDKLSFVFFGHGAELGVDPGRAKSQAYRLPIHSRWYRATISHNTVVVDGKSQEPAAGELLAFAANDRYAAALAACDAAYPGVKHRRLLLLTPAYLLVVDDLASDAPRRFDWLYHHRAEAVDCAAAVQETAPEANYPGQEYLQRLRLGRTDETLRAVFAGKTVETRLTAAAMANTEVRTGDGPAESVEDRVPMIMLTRRGPAARFAVVLEPVQAGVKPAIRDVRIDPLGVIHVEGAVTDTITISPDHRITVRQGNEVVLD